MFGRNTLDITLDSGATVSYMRVDVAYQLGLNIMPNSQLAMLADKRTRLRSVGEVDCLVTLHSIQLRLRALLMEDLQADCFGGTTFHADNGIQTNIKERTVSIHGKYLVKQDNSNHYMPLFPPPAETLSNAHAENGSSLNVRANEQSCQPATLRTVDPIGTSRATAPTRVQDKTTKFNAISLPTDNVVLPGDFLKIPMSLNGPHDTQSVATAFMVQ